MSTKLNILFAEDETQTRENIANYISLLYNHNVIQAVDGEDAWSKYLKYNPHIIISDLQMPKLSGLELIQKIREVDQDIKIIVLSAYDDKEKLLEAIKLNLVDYLIKPLNRKTLNTIIENLEIEFMSEENGCTKVYLDESIYYDLENACMINGSEEMKLTQKEALFIELMVAKRGQTVSSFEIHNYIYDLETDFNINAIRTLIKKLRKKLPENSIENIYGGSYKLHTKS